MNKKNISNRQNAKNVISAGQSEMSTLSQVTSKAEKAYIERTLRSMKGNKTKAAEILGISRKTLWEKIKAYGIEQ